MASEVPILIPGVGTQGGDAAEAVTRGGAADGTLAVVNVSRQVIYASSGPDWQDAAGDCAHFATSTLPFTIRASSNGFSVIP